MTLVTCLILLGLRCQPNIGHFEGPVSDFCASASSDSKRISVVAILANEPIFVISPKGAVTPERFLKPLAELFLGAWEEDAAGNLRLILPPAQTKKESCEELKKRTARLADWIEERKDRLSAMEGEDAALRIVLNQLSEWRKRSSEGSLIANGRLAVMPKSPLDTLLERLLVSIGPDALAAPLPGSTIAYCSHPVGDQRPFPQAAHKAINAYVAATDRLSAALSTADKPTGPYASIWDPVFASLKPAPVDPRVLLTLVPSYSHLIFRLRVYSSDGTCLGVSTTEIPQGLPKEGPPPIPVLIDKLPQRVQIGGKGQALLKLLEAGSAAMAVHRAGPLSNTDVLFDRTFEPLSLALHEALVALAEVSGCTVMACLPDASLGPALAAISDGHVNARELLRRLLSQRIVSLEVLPDIILLRPCAPVDCRRMRVDRAALRTFASAIINEGSESIRSETQFCFRGGPGSCYGEVQRLWRQCLVPFGLNSINAPIRFWLGRLLGSLDELRWKSAFAGEALPFRALDRVQREDFRKWLESSPPENPHFSYEPSVTISYASLDYSLSLNRQYDPIIWCSAPGSSSLASIPARPMRATDLARTLRVNGVAPSELESILTGKYDLLPAHSFSAFAWLGKTVWSDDRLGTQTSGSSSRSVSYQDWPDQIRAALIEYLRQINGSVVNQIGVRPSRE